MLPEQMLAVRLHQYGAADRLEVERVAVPRPAAGEALVRIDATGLNFIETYQRRGLYPVALPAVLGGEAAGIVEAVGADVGDVHPGQRVAWAAGFGCYAEYAVVPVARLVPLPVDLTTRLAAAVMLQGMTAHYLASSVWPLQQGERCLIHAAAGGVGLLLVQIARRRGARVIGTVGSEAKAALARAAGADDVIVYTRDDFVAEVRRITADRGVDVVFDSVGRTTFVPGLDVIRPRGMMVLYGQSSGPVEPLDPQQLSRRGSLFLTRPTLAHYTATRQELLRRANDLFTWIGRGELDVRVGAEYALADVAEAHHALESRRTTGKVLLLPHRATGAAQNA